MSVRILPYDTSYVAEIAEALLAGAVAVVPTDTVYGAVARAADRDAIERLYHLKSRVRKPGTLIAASIDQLVELGVPRRYFTGAQQYWPGPVSVVLPTVPALSYLDQGVGTLAMRLPDDEQLRQLLERTGPLMTSSANLPGQPESKTIAEAEEYFGEKIDLYVDGGKRDRPASTVIRIVDDAVEILRMGAVKINEKGEIIE